jgi:hypothetical protein
LVSLFDLWLPILASAVAVFVCSSVMHMVLRYHRSDVRNLPNEDAARTALRPLAIPPGDYIVPGVPGTGDYNDPERIAKLKEGPVMFMTVLGPGVPGMGKPLALWASYCVLVGLIAAYVVGGLLGPGAPYMTVHRFIAAVAFAGYGVGQMQNAIWFRRSWSATGKALFDAVIFAMITGGIFGWLWPEG